MGLRVMGGGHREGVRCTHGSEGHGRWTQRGDYTQRGDRSLVDMAIVLIAGLVGSAIN